MASRKTPPPRAYIAGEMPMCIRAGANIETWSPTGNPSSASGAVLRAWARWQHLNGKRGGVGTTTPWSYHWLAETNPAHLAYLLDRLGLPADWTPSPAPTEWVVSSADLRRLHAQSWHPTTA